MKSEVKEISPTQRELHIEIPAEDLKTAYGLVTKKYSKGATVPGFRKGYAPLDVIRVRYQEEIKNEVLQQVLPLKVAEALEEHEIQPLAEPHLHIDDVENVKVNGSQPVALHVHVEVMPEIPLPAYEGLEVTRRIKPIDEAEIEELIARRIDQEAALIPVERASEIGDTVVADLEGRFEGESDAEPIKAEDLEVKLGDEVIEKAFTENLVGVKQDDEKDFTVTYPAEFSSAALAGKTVHYKAKIKSVGTTEKPELNDEWVKSLDEGFESLADLRKKLRLDLEAYAKTDADARVRNEAVEKLIKDNEFEVPNTLIENQARNLLNNFARDLQGRGVDLNKVENEFLQMAFQQMRSQAERDVRGAMLLEKIAEAEKVEVKPDEVEAEISKMAEYYRSTVEELKESLEKQGGTSAIENNLRTRKTIEALISKAAVTDGVWVEPSAEPGMESSSEDEQKPKKAPKKKASAKKAAKEA